jgi:signal transduction histidine kinase
MSPHSLPRATPEPPRPGIPSCPRDPASPHARTSGRSPAQADNETVDARTQDITRPAGSRAGIAARSLLTAPLRRRTYAELAYLVVSAPLGVAGFCLLTVLLPLGASLAIIIVGLPLIAATVRGARRLAVLHRRLACALLGERAGEPRPPRQESGLPGWVRSGLGDSAGWRAVAYLVLRAPVALAGMYVVVALWIYYGLLNLLAPLLWIYHSPGQASAQIVLRAPTNAPMLAVHTLPGTLVLAAIGVAALLTAPWAVRGVVVIDRFLIRRLLCPRSLSERVRDLEETRARAVDGSADMLRRIERDLHDGAQVRLTALAMTLGEIKENLQDPGDPDSGRTRMLVEAAHQNAKQALAELRDLARGIHPPVLDRGLETALATLAATSATPAGLTAAIRNRPSPAIETIAYFCAAELLANVAKHSRARRATIGVTDHGGRLLLTVTDDGAGTAHLTPAGGLAGLLGRVQTVDGHLDIDSPPGGPTVITVELPSHA